MHAFPLFLLLTFTFGAEGEPATGSSDVPLQSWGALLDLSAKNPETAEARAQFLSHARELAAEPIIRRATRLEDVGQNRTWLDGRSRALEDEIRETFALAMSDFAACRTLSDELPVLAAAYRLTNDKAFLERAIAQLAEMVSWKPLQRPGWTLYSPGHRLPPDGKDGNWLATGCGVRAIGDTLDILPEGAIGKSLQERIVELLEGEIAGVRDDWETRRPWFVSSNNPITNQWMLPTEGLVRACLILGVDENKEAYDLGVKNLLMSMDAHGRQGEFEEGFGYASFTMTSMLHTAHAMAVAGDRRAIEHPFLRNFPTWLVHHFQPGDYVINCFDAGGSFGASKSSQSLLALFAVCTGSPVARWALEHQLGGPSNDLSGLASRGLGPVDKDAAPPLFASYERATRVNWSSSWDSDATGVWVRGGHELDQHDHQDRGHVNFISRGRPILIEAGTPSYDHSLMMTHYSTGVGHNVLQLGTEFPVETADAGKHFWLPGWQKRGGVAPISVARLDASGGEVTVDGSSCYDGLGRWLRRVKWGVGDLEVEDEVSLREGAGKEVILFRWHLGAEEEVSIAGEGMEYTVTWGDARVSITADVPLVVSQTPMPDHTLAGHDGSEDPANKHQCVVVQSKDPVSALRLNASVEPK
jgi:hypothetical protein